MRDAKASYCAHFADPWWNAISVSVPVCVLCAFAVMRQQVPQYEFRLPMAFVQAVACMPFRCAAVSSPEKTSTDAYVVS